MTESGFTFNPTFSSDSKWIVYTGPERKADSLHSPRSTGIWRIPIEGGEPVPLFDKAANRPAVSPDGRWVAFFYNEAEGPKSERGFKLGSRSF